jgi:hypothetical protein
MNRSRFLVGALLALGLSVGVTAPAFAQPKGPPPKTKPKEAPKASTAEAPTVSKPITIQPKDLAWSIDKKKLGSIYDKQIEEDYKSRYQKTQPGPSMDALDAEVAEKKAEFRRSLIEFGTVPTGMDSTVHRAEYSYNNKEAIMSIERGGKTRTFFFIQDKMWKVTDGIKLGEKSQWGKTFDEAVTKLNTFYGVNGRVREADAAAGRPFKEVDWKDAQTQVRAVDWGNDQFGIVFQDAATAANITTLRKNKDPVRGEVDAKVKDAGRAKEPAGPPPKDPPKGKTPPPKKK